MKKTCMVLLVFLLILPGCSRVNEPVELPEDTYIYDLFTEQEKAYVLRYDGKHAYISTESSDGPICYQLPGGEDTVWHSASGRLYYGDGCRIYSCDITGNEKTLVWKLPNGTKKDFARVEALSDDLFLICVGYGSRDLGQGSGYNPYVYDTYQYYSLNVATGEANAVMDKVSYEKLPFVLCTYGNEVMLLQKTGTDTISVLRVDLLSAERTELGSFSPTMTLTSADGFVLEDTLYFIYNYSGICSVPLSGGEVGFGSLYNEQERGMTMPVSVTESDGKAYVLVWDGATYPTAMLCELEPNSGILHAVDEEKSTFPEAIGFYIDDSSYFIFSAASVTSGELPN